MQKGRRVRRVDRASRRVTTVFRSRVDLSTSLGMVHAGALAMRGGGGGARGGDDDAMYLTASQSREVFEVRLRYLALLFLDFLNRTVHGSRCSIIVC